MYTIFLQEHRISMKPSVLNFFGLKASNVLNLFLTFLLSKSALISQGVINALKRSRGPNFVTYVCELMQKEKQDSLYCKYLLRFLSFVCISLSILCFYPFIL